MSNFNEPHQVNIPQRLIRPRSVLYKLRIVNAYNLWI